MLIPETKTAVILEADSPHSRSVIDTLLRHNREEKQRVYNLVSAELLHTLNVTTAPRCTLSNAEAVAEADATAVAANARRNRLMKPAADFFGISAKVRTPEVDDTRFQVTGRQKKDEEDEEKLQKVRPWPYMTMPPSYDSPVFWSTSPPFSTVRESHGTTMVHIDQGGRVSHVGLREPVNDRLKSSRMLSETMVRIWTQRNVEMEQLEREAEERDQLEISSSHADYLPAEKAMLNTLVDAAHNEVSSTAADTQWQEPADGNIIDEQQSRCLAIFTASSETSTECCAKRFASVSRLGKKVLEAEHEKRIRERYCPPWRLRIVVPPVLLEEVAYSRSKSDDSWYHPGDTQAINLLKYFSDLSAQENVDLWPANDGEWCANAGAFAGAWAVFSATFDNQGFPRCLPSDWHTRLVDSIITHDIEYLVVCSVGDSPSQPDEGLPECMLRSRNFLNYVRQKDRAIRGFSHLPISLAFETAYEYGLFDIQERVPASWHMRFRYPTSAPLPWSSVADVGPAVLMAWHQRRSGIADTPWEYPMVSDCLSALELRAQCLQLIYIANRALVVEPYSLEQWVLEEGLMEQSGNKIKSGERSRDDVFAKTWGGRECRHLLNFWIRFRYDATTLLKPRIGADVTLGAKEHRLTGWSNWALARIDVLFPGWNAGLDLPSSSKAESGNVSNERLTRIATFEDKSLGSFSHRLQDALSGNEGNVFCKTAGG